MDFTQTFQSPVIACVGGSELTLPRLTIRDYALWTAQVHAQRKVTSAKLMPASLSPLERFKAARAVEFEEPTLEDMAALLLTPAGAAKALTLSLAKAGKSDAEAQQLLESLPPPMVMSLAMEVSSLYEKKEPPTRADGGDADPLALRPSPAD